MGISCSKKDEKENLFQNLKESWNYDGNIYQIINDVLLWSHWINGTKFKRST
jgi:hypothetical protein